MDINKIKKYSEFFSLIVVNEHKIPAHKWKDSQTNKIEWDTFESLYNKHNNFGIVTGYDNLECIDIDLKVFSTTKEKIEFWEEYYNLLKENILDFDDKFIIYKTKNAGYHILYKSKRVEGNLKIAKLKNHKEQVIETRGIGGYIFAYPQNKVSKKDYFEIEYITDDDRDILMQLSKSYNYVIQKPDIIKNEKKENFGDINPWDDFNQKNDIFSVISDEFTIVKHLKSKYLIKRNGANSFHSGYVFKDTGCMFLFSTGTHYEIEKVYSPFTAYAKRYHDGDLSAAASQLYQEGYGSRFVKKQNEPIETIEIKKTDLNFPIEIFPKPIQSYILQCSKTLDSSIDYMGCALLWVISLSIGNSIQIEVKRGWKEIATVWIAIVGKAGIGKTPSISNIIFPLEKINNKEIYNYIKKYEEYENFSTLSAQEKKEYPDVVKPVKNQFLANDITLEALVDLHQQSQNSVGVFKDELAGWFKDMNKYKAGSDLEFWLSTWSGQAVNLNRITRAGSFVAKPLIPVMGGIQPGIFNTFYTDENKDNGFLDRMLLSYPELNINKYNDDEMSSDVITWYSDTIINFYEHIKHKVFKTDEQGKIEPIVISFSKEGKKEWIRIFNEITDIQNSDAENEYMKSMLPKQKSYIPRFCLLIHVFESSYNANSDFMKVSKESVLKAEKLSNYFIAMAKKVKVDTSEIRKIKTVIKDSKGKTNFDIFKNIYKENPNVKIKDISEQLNLSLKTVYSYRKTIQENE